ncbi:hypothetical protein AWP88_04495, partial [Escherichia coli]
MRHYRSWMWDFFILLATLTSTKKREVQLLFCGVLLRVD